MPLEKLKAVLVDQEQYEASELLEVTNPFARVLHGGTTTETTWALWVSR